MGMFPLMSGTGRKAYPPLHNNRMKREMLKYTETSERPIFKYIPLKYLIKMLDDDTLYVNKVATWDDVYENFFLKQRFVYENRVVPSEMLNEIFGGIFGQSWTSLKSSDAMWRIFSKYVSGNCDEDELSESAIRVASTPNLVYGELCKAGLSDDYGMKFCEVKYMSHDEIEHWLDDIGAINRQNMVDLILKSLFIKRKDFEHEHEVRIIIYVKSLCSNAKSDTVIVPIHTQNMITEYVIDPRMNGQQCNVIMSMLKRHGANESLVRQSGLYTLNKKTLVLEC